jgi:hypothetical protein
MRHTALDFPGVQIKNLKTNTMNLEQALPWTALIAAIGFFSYCFYKMIKEERSGNEQPVPNKKRQAPKPAAVSAGNKAFVKGDQLGTSIVSQVSDITNSNVEVNITNYPINTEPASVKRGQKPVIKTEPCNNSQPCEKLFESDEIGIRY